MMASTSRQEYPDDLQKPSSASFISPQCLHFLFIRFVLCAIPECGIQSCLYTIVFVVYVVAFLQCHKQILKRLKHSYFVLSRYFWLFSRHFSLFTCHLLCFLVTFDGFATVFGVFHIGKKLLHSPDSSGRKCEYNCHSVGFASWRQHSLDKWHSSLRHIHISGMAFLFCSFY